MGRGVPAAMGEGFFLTLEKSKFPIFSNSKIFKNVKKAMKIL